MTTPNATASQRRRRETPLTLVLGPLLLLTLIFFIHFVARQIIGPLLPAMEADLGLSHTRSGLFMLFTGMGFFVSQISAAFLAARWGYRACILISLWGSVVVTALLGLGHSLWALYLGFLCLGITGGLYVPSGIALITVLVQPNDWGKAMGIHELAPNLALISVPFLATMAVTAGSWRLGFLGLTVTLAALALLYGFTGVDSYERPSPPDLSRIRQIVATSDFWRMGLLLSLAIGVETGVYAVTPLYLVNERGFDLATANQLLGLSRIPGVFIVLLAGWITDRLSPATTVKGAFGLTGAAVIALGAGPPALLAPAVFLQAAAAACLFPPILSMVSQMSIAANRALTLSLMLSVAPLVGSGLLPAAIAWAGDLGSFGMGMVCAGLLTMAGIGLVKR